MYLEHFRLSERPFSNAPDPRFVYLGAQHERALAHLLHGVRDANGIVHLTGEHGHGKTTICRVLLHRLPENVDVALILNPVLTPGELLATVCDELGVAGARNASGPTLADALTRRLEAHAGARRTVLIVDDAQSLSLDVLEQLRRLSSLERDGRPLLQIVLIGEPGLIEPLGRLSPAAVAGYHLLPLAENDTCAYVRHRLATAGSTGDLFDVDALRDVHRLSGGVPRLINAICHRALLGATVQQHRGVDRLTVRAAARAVLAPAGAPELEIVEAPPRVAPVRRVQKPPPAPARAAPTRAGRTLWPWLVGGGLALNAAVIGAVFLVPSSTDVAAPPPVAVATTEPPARVETPPAPTAPVTNDLAGVVREAAPPPPRAEPAAPAASIPPPRAEPTAPAPSFAPERYPPSRGTARQRRQARANRGALWSATSPPVSNFEPEPDSPSHDSAQLKVDLLVWAADPRERMVYLNGHKYVEGERLDNGAVIEQIAQDGVVLVHGGRRVRLRSETR